jgi:hypothetical protein
MDEAQGAAGAAREQFREIAEQVRGLLAEEQADRVAAAQRLAAELARQQQDFVDRLARSENKGGIGDMPPKDGAQGGASTAPSPKGNEDPMNGLGGAAEKIADKAETLADVLGGAGLRLLAHLDAEARPLRDVLEGALAGEAAGSIVLLVGPEGGFSDAEAEEARRSGAIAVSLGGTRLRTETAAIVAVALTVDHARRMA